jgi:hypothetical protein
MALSTSFTGGWFFLGQFFDHAVAGHPPVDKLPLGMRRTERDVQRSRARMVAPTPAEIIERVAHRFAADLDVRRALDALKRELDENDIDWSDEYKFRLIQLHDELLAAGRTAKPAADPRDEWMRRRLTALRRTH